jgi:hypothetical protein
MCRHINWAAKLDIDLIGRASSIQLDGSLVEKDRNSKGYIPSMFLCNIPFPFNCRLIIYMTEAQFSSMCCLRSCFDTQTSLLLWATYISSLFGSGTILSCARHAYPRFQDVNFTNYLMFRDGALYFEQLCVLRQQPRCPYCEHDADRIRSDRMLFSDSPSIDEHLARCGLRNYVDAEVK